jgi:radical SAM enzyme (TIGR01210 family)
MFIDQVVAKIWEPVQAEYDKAYSKFKKMDLQQLFKMLERRKAGFYRYPGVVMNMIPTNGCPHRFAKEKFSGCSMCDYHSTGAPIIAAMAVLREKDAGLYSKVIKQNFVNIRGIKAEPDVFESISACDSLDDYECPEEVYEELFGSGDLFNKRPFRYIIEARASSITAEKLEMVKKYLGKRGKAFIEFGTELYSQWMRNHWLNKDIADADIKKAVDSIHDAGFKAHTDVLIGIPGLTEKQSIHIFKETVLRLVQWGVDEIMCLPLNRKKQTLHGYLYHRLRDNPTLDNLGLVQGEHTGLPWLFTVVEALGAVLEEKPGLIDRLRIAQILPETNAIENETAFNKDRTCDCNTRVIEMLQLFRRNLKNSDLVLELRDDLHKDPCYQDYLALIAKQEKAGDIKETLTTTATEIAKTMWPENWQKQIADFKEELTLFTDQVK